MLKRSPLFRMAKAKTDFTDYIQAFEDELNSFIKRVEDRAKARIEKAKAEAEEVRITRSLL